jgi:hypothetical protein
MNTKQFKIFLQKLNALETELSHQKGDFVLFGVFLRDGSPDRWDVVVSAPWLDEDDNESLRFMVKQIQAKIELPELLLVATVLILDPSQEFVQEMNDEVRVEHGNVKITDYIFNGMSIERAHIITSKPVATPQDGVTESPQHATASI